MGPSLSTQSSLKDREPWQPVAAESCLLAQLFLIEPSVDLEELSPAADLSQGQADLRHQVQFFLAQAKSFLELAESSPDLAELSLDLVSIDSSRLGPALVSPPALLWVSPPAQWSPLSRSPELSPLDLWLLSKNPELANPCSGGTQLLSSITQFITPSPPRPP